MSIQNTTLLATVPNTILLSQPSPGVPPTTKGIGPSGTSAITVVYFCNISGSTLPVDVHVVPYGGTPDISNVIYKGIQLAPSDTYVLDTERLLLDNGDSLVAFTTVNASIVATVSYTGI